MWAEIFPATAAPIQDVWVSATLGVIIAAIMYK
ncbi:hypothetical protein Vch1786_I2472 [Vibrio cholerae O1 str. 2010EL-1786]|uniref:Uncharacterized protein n=1 Tax=Vibrio cholerae serotype O1 (strain ATCC 39315 / El Tor Inaba N16961) TaxID=243277 RepID=Q9KVF7_VIBCH|nr:hypothetical protein VC_0189 [Vibrio cholerae O1 biovar El Tor str. N16961]ACP08246.1 conserved hypothetical protein [Vibrio cholerae O395]AET28035.1 hypothetical protein Vch1786_I2472 [Vibrio cholerae O1 str. 2010EL-1786]